MTSRARGWMLNIAGLAMAFTLGFIVSPHFHTTSIAAQKTAPAHVRDTAPAFETGRIAPADVLGGPRWLPSHGEN